MMGTFTKRLSRRRRRPSSVVDFYLVDAVASRLFPLEEQDRRFAMRQLLEPEADGTEAQFLRAVWSVGGRRLTQHQLVAWWWRIGSRARSAVRLCFYEMHAPE